MSVGLYILIVAVISSAKGRALPPWASNGKPVGNLELIAGILRNCEFIMAMKHM